MTKPIAAGVFALVLALGGTAYARKPHVQIVVDPPVFVPTVGFEYGNGYYRTHDGHYYHYDRDRDGWHYGRDHRAGERWERRHRHRHHHHDHD
jgi:hypothetical protein